MWDCQQCGKLRPRFPRCAHSSAGCQFLEQTENFNFVLSFNNSQNLMSKTLHAPMRTLRFVSMTRRGNKGMTFYTTNHVLQRDIQNGLTKNRIQFSGSKAIFCTPPHSDEVQYCLPLEKRNRVCELKKGLRVIFAFKLTSFRTPSAVIQQKFSSTPSTDFAERIICTLTFLASIHL